MGVEPPLEPLLEPFELGDLAFDFEPDDLELADFGFALFAAFGFAALDFVDFGFAAFDFEALGLAFDFDCDFGFDFDCGFDFDDDPALFGADRFLDLVSAIFLSPRGVPY
jgi:hypothetical protein